MIKLFRANEAFHICPNIPAGGEAWPCHRFERPCRKEEEVQPDDEIQVLRRKALNLAGAGQ